MKKLLVLSCLWTSRAFAQASVPAYVLEKTGGTRQACRRTETGLAAVLRSRHYAGLSVQSKVFEVEDHLTVFPGLVTRGLKWALPPKKK